MSPLYIPLNTVHFSAHFNNSNCIQSNKISNEWCMVSSVDLLGLVPSTTAVPVHVCSVEFWPLTSEHLPSRRKPRNQKKNINHPIRI